MGTDASVNDKLPQTPNTVVHPLNNRHSSTIEVGVSWEKRGEKIVPKKIEWIKFLDTRHSCYPNGLRIFPDAPSDIMKIRAVMAILMGEAVIKERRDNGLNRFNFKPFEYPDLICTTLMNKIRPLESFIKAQKPYYESDFLGGDIDEYARRGAALFAGFLSLMPQFTEHERKILRVLAPTERSIPAPIMTKVMARAMMPISIQKIQFPENVRAILATPLKTTTETRNASREIHETGKPHDRL